MRRRAILGYGAAGVGVVALMLFAGWWQVDGPGGPEPIGQRPVALTAMDFRLTDHEGNAVGPETLIRRPTMAFFGFTYCPDVCPTTLSDISGWLDDLGDEADVSIGIQTGPLIGAQKGPLWRCGEQARGGVAFQLAQPTRACVLEGVQARVLMRQLSLPVSTMSQWWVSRSSSAVVIFASPKTVGHSPNARLVVTMTEVCS